MKNPLAIVGQAFRDMRAGREARSTLANPDSWLLAALGSGVTKSGATVGEGTAFNVPTVAACVNILAQSIAMLPLKVYRRTPTGAEEATDHPLSHLLKRKPGAAQTSYQWRAWMQTCLGLGGNGYSRIHRNSFFEVQRIEPVKASDVEVRRLEDGRLAYRVHGAGLLPAEDMIHVRGLSSNGFTGRSPLHDLRESVGLALVAQEFSARSFSNGNRKPGIIQGKEGMTKAKAEEFLSFWMANYAGTANAGKNPLIWGAEWKDMGMTNSDAELLITRKFEVEEIARAYRVPLTLLQSMEKSTSFGTGIAELSRGFVNYTLMPWLCNWEQELEDKLLTEQEKNATNGLFIKFSVGAMLRGSPLEQAQKAEIERRARLITVNEYRRQQDLNEFSDTGANNPDWPLNAQESGQRSPGRAPADDPAAAERSATEARAAEHRQLLDTIRSLPVPEVHVAAPVINFEERSIVAETTIAEGAVRVETHLPAATARRVTRDASGQITGTEPMPDFATSGAGSAQGAGSRPEQKSGHTPGGQQAATGSAKN